MNVAPRIAVSEAQIDLVVNRFYQRARAHVTLGPIFAAHVTDWTRHEAKITQFWRNAVLMQRCYDGNPMQIHAAAGNVRAEHFPVWLSLFDDVLVQTLPEPLAQAWSALAHRIGRGLSVGLPQDDGAAALSPYLGETWNKSAPRK